MTIQEMIDKLLEVPTEERDLKIYVCNQKTNDNIEVKSVDLFDNEREHNEENILGINF